MSLLTLALAAGILALPGSPATAQTDGDALCAAAQAAASGGASSWNGYEIVRAPNQSRSGSQVVLGTDGPDTFTASTDPSVSELFCGFGGNDGLDTLRDGSVFLGGDGADQIDTMNGGIFEGGDGDDQVGRERDSNPGMNGGIFNWGCGRRVRHHPDRGRLQR